MSKIAIYPGTFDPPTNGHIDVALRAEKLFDTLYITVANNAKKKTTFTAEERAALLSEIFIDHPKIHVEIFSGLLADYAKMKGASALVRGLRAVSDFEYEIQTASFNREFAPEIETVFFMANTDNLFVSSSIIKEAAKFGGDISRHVHPIVLKELKKKSAENTL